MVIDGINIFVQKKKIKNAYIAIKPPYGEVFITTPLSMSDTSIKMYAKMKMPWIKKQRQIFEDQKRQTQRMFVSGESIYLFGNKYLLEFVENNKNNSFFIKGKKVILSMRGSSTKEQREKYMKKQYKILLENKLLTLIPIWEEKTGIKISEFKIRYMTTLWGTCKPTEKKIWFNLQLVHKPIHCIEYIILHELCHILENKHSQQFYSLLNNYMPNWEDMRKELNEFILDYYN